MSAANGSAEPQGVGEIVEKGKGKAVNATPGHDMSMDDDDDSSEEESGVEDTGDVEEEDEDNMEEIDTANILPDSNPRGTRGKQIDWAKAAEKSKEEGDELDDEDEDDDDDFEAPEEGDKMEE